MTDALLAAPISAPAQDQAAARAAAAANADEFGAPSARLQAAFATIARTRMEGVPILNPALRVECVGFRRWNGFWLGVLVTPWCMNLMLLPAVSALWPRKRIGEKLKYVFPAGVFEFIAGREALLAAPAAASPVTPAAGPAAELRESYLMCSLFSPVFDFADHEGAVATAAACLDALFDEANYVATEMAVTRAPASISADAAAAAAAAEQAERDAAATVSSEPDGQAHDEAVAAGGAVTDAAPAVPPMPTTPTAPATPTVSKRNFLRGRWSSR
jgi:[NiFe] hydrogenase assembly HybE family chaperone